MKTQSIGFAVQARPLSELHVFIGSKRRIVEGKNAMNVRIKAEVCVGHAMCIIACPQMFELSDEDGHAWVRSETVPPELEEHVRQAERSCPEGAIVVY